MGIFIYALFIPFGKALEINRDTHAPSFVVKKQLVQMNMKSFYDSVRANLFKGTISSKQFEGIEAILAEYNKLCVNDPRKLAYILATVYHETGRAMQPIEEGGKGRGLDYGKKLKMSRLSYSQPDKIYYGRGLVQLTWYENYLQMGKILGIDLLNHPELMLDMEVSVKVLFEGMLKGKSSFGDFTGKSLENYFNADNSDALNARRIINGMDKAQQIEGYFKLFYNAITLL